MSRQSTLWDKANVSYKNYLHYIGRKTDKFELSLIDLLFVGNFKGGNASIHEEEPKVDSNLKKYSKRLRDIYNKFGDRPLRDLSNEELESLKKKAKSFVCLTLHKDTSIYGFGSSYASALLHFHFPSLVPILDRRVLNGLGIAKVLPKRQVKNIEDYYCTLIDHFYGHLKEHPSISLRDHDYENFKIPLPQSSK